MKVWSVIFNFFAVMLLLYMTYVLIEDVKLNKQQFNEMRLKYAVDYATEAAFQQAIQGGRLGIDYTDLSSVRIIADNTLPAFRASMALSYDISMSNSNLRMIDNYISSAALVVSDGYYLATEQEVDTVEYNEQGGVYELKWGLKKPFTIEYDAVLGASNVKTLVGYSISGEKWKAVRQINGANTVETAYGDVWDELPQGTENVCTPETETLVCTKYKSDLKQDIIREANRLITQDINYYIKERNAKTDNYVKHDFVYLPAKQTETGVNPVERPSLLVTMSDVSFAGLDDVSVNSVGGFTVIIKKRVVGFEENGQKYYAYEGQIPQPRITDISRYFDNIDKAVKAGYEPHLEYLTKPANFE